MQANGIMVAVRMGQGLALAGALLMLGGCLVLSDSKSKRLGSYVADSTFGQIQPGSTTADWLKATLGEPTQSSKLDEQDEIWKWTSVECKDSAGYVFLIFGSAHKNETASTVFVELKNGVVARKWRG